MKKAAAALAVLAAFCLALAFAKAKPSAKGQAPGSKDAKIARALSAGPASIRQAALVAELLGPGKMNILRPGYQDASFDCFSGHPGVVGDDPFCADGDGMQWIADWMRHKPRPTNLEPGIIYMLAGGTDWSATDPWATSGQPIHEPPHWMILWPVSPKSGLPTTPKQTGTWIMWAGTPYAHLMINQRP